MSEKSVKRTECSGMLAKFEAANLLRRIAEPRGADDSVKVMIGRAARRVSEFWPLSAGRAENIWRKEARVIRAEEMDAMRAAARQRQEEAGRAKASELIERYAKIAEHLRKVDPDFYREQIDGLEHVGAQFGARRGAVDGAGGTD